MRDSWTRTGVSVTGFEAEAERQRRLGATAVYLAADGRAAGLIAIADPVKPSTPAALRALTADGVRILMLTGDSATTARAVADRLGIGRGRGRSVA